MIRYAKLGYVALNVTDLSRSAAFYGPEVVGLAETESDGPDRYFRCSVDHHNLILSQNKEPGLKRLGWELESDEVLEQTRAALVDAGVTVHDVPEEERARLNQGPSFRISEPYTGATYEYYSMIGDYSGIGWVPTVANIARLGHVILKTDRYAEAVEFHEKVLNFKCSDIIGSFVKFYRCWPNPYHHTFGLQNAAKKGFSHINFMVSDIDDIGRALGRFHKQQVRIAWGPGRHPPSGSIFLYFLDPDGMTAEYSFGMEEFPEVGARKPRLLMPTQENIDFWDAPRLAEISEVGSVEPLIAYSA